MPNNTTLTATTPEEMLRVLKDSDYDTAIALHVLGQSLGCKIEPKTGAKSYKVMYWVLKPKKRALFTIECSEKKWRVKANLFRIAAYQDNAQQAPEAVKAAIKKTRPCVLCNPGCAWHPAYELDGERYLPCYGAGHYFSKLSKDDWVALMGLIALESGAHLVF